MHEQPASPEAKISCDRCGAPVPESQMCIKPNESIVCLYCSGPATQRLGLYRPEDSPIEDTHPGQWVACGIDAEGYPRSGTGPTAAAALIALAAAIEPKERPPLTVYPLQADGKLALVVAHADRAARDRFTEYYGMVPDGSWDGDFECRYTLISADDDYEY